MPVDFCLQMNEYRAQPQRSTIHKDKFTWGVTPRLRAVFGELYGQFRVHRLAFGLTDYAGLII